MSIEEIRGMSKVREELRLAQDCYAQARITLDPDVKGALRKLGDRYLRQAEELKLRRAV
jgi:hypothetical protein